MPDIIKISDSITLESIITDTNGVGINYNVSFPYSISVGDFVKDAVSFKDPLTDIYKNGDIYVYAKDSNLLGIFKYKDGNIYMYIDDASNNVIETDIIAEDWFEINVEHASASVLLNRINYEIYTEV